VEVPVSQPQPTPQSEAFREYQIIIEEARAQRGARDSFNTLYVNLITLIFAAQGYVLLTTNDLNTNLTLRAALIFGLSIIGSFLCWALRRTLGKIDALNSYRYKKLAEWEATLNLPPDFRYYQKENEIYMDGKPVPELAPKARARITAANGILDDLPTVMIVLFGLIAVAAAAALYLHIVQHVTLMLP
jgi:hypothetical protein